MTSRVKSSPLRVFMTADAVGGVWQYALDLAGGLVRHGVETTLAVLGPAPNPAQAAEAAGVPGLAVIGTGLPLDWTAASPAEVIEAGREVARLARDARPDVVHLNGPALAAEAAFPAPVVSACHSCVATWWEAVRGGAAPDDFAWRTGLVARGYRASRALVAPSRAFAEATARAYGLAAPPRVVPNGRAAPLPSEVGVVPPGEPFAFTAGRLWDEGKNLAVLDAAAGRMRAPLVAAGPLEGPNGARIALRHVRTLGALPGGTVAGWLAARPVFVSAALYEPFGLAVLEAAQAGCPLVLSDIPTFRELWEGAALFAPPGDDAAIAAAVEGLLAEPGRAATLGEAARSRALLYTADAMAAGYIDLYRSLLPGAGAASRGGLGKSAA